MRCSVISRLFIFIAFFCNSAFADCINQQTTDAPLPAIQSGHAWAKSCGDQDQGGGDIYVKIAGNGLKNVNLHLRYEPDSYVLTLDTDIFFGDAKAQGVGVGTGGGRDANGMHYWMIDGTGKVIDLGEAPLLKRNSFMKGTYSALVTSSNSPYQSILYFYEIKNKKLTSTKAVGFESGPNGNIASLLVLLPDDKYRVVSKRRLTQIEYASCQSGKSACW
ncbi:hypothetical protein VSR34_18455 [Paraburkholderia sp. JHI2823]|uniref:hypothetical protein n=1 Tax=Paraburkholderia sp. JHI2823 TaxID=3112960 RepID=UPI0031806470